MRGVWPGNTGAKMADPTILSPTLVGEIVSIGVMSGVNTGTVIWYIVRWPSGSVNQYNERHLTVVG